MVALAGGMFASGTNTPRLGIDLAGGTSITLTAKNQPGAKNAINKQNMDTAVNIIERRVNGLGVSEAEVQTQGDRNIIVNIPRGTDEKQARQQVGTTAQLHFRPVLAMADGKPTAAPSKNPSAEKGESKADGTAQDGKGGKPSKGPGGATDKAVSEGSDSEETGESTAAPSQGVSGESRSAEGDSEKTGATSSESDPPQKHESQPPSPPPQESEGDIPSALQKKLDALDCSDPEARATAGVGVRPGDQTVACGQDGKIKYALGPAAVEGTGVDSAKAAFDNQRGQGWIVQMDFNDSGSKKFGEITSRLADKPQPQNQFAIELDGQVVSAPSVHERLTGSAEISGNFTQQSAEDLANVLSYGALPLTFDESSVTSVSAALGGEQLRAGLIAGAIGLILVVLYLVAYYRGLAAIAVLSLLASAVLTYTIMTLLGPGIGFALNLPAVCGAIVAIGITADSFIVYFERIQDQIREGRTLQPAVQRAWPRARRTILVADFVSFLAAAVLFVATVGKVQGFAFTLGLTTVLDVVVVFFFTKPVMTMLARRKFFASGHPWSGLDPRRLGARAPIRGRRRPTTVSSAPKEA